MPGIMSWPTPRVLVVPLASRLHGTEYVGSLLEKLKRVLPSGFTLHEVVSSRSGLEKLDPKGYDALVAVVATGGVSGLLRELVRVARGSGVPVLIVAHPHHNSLPSALSATAKLRSEGIRVPLAKTGARLRGVSRWLRVAGAVAQLRRARVLHVGGGREDAEEYRRRIGGEVVYVDGRVLADKASGIGPDEVREELRRVSLQLDLGGSRAEDVAECLKVYVALRRLVREHGCQMVSIDCFPYLEETGYTPCLALALLPGDGVPAACEADYRSLLLLGLSQLLAGEPGWMANLCDYKRGGEFEPYYLLALAHCTVPLRLVSYAGLLPHFETGLPYAVAGRLDTSRDYTLAAVSPGYKWAVVASARVTRSGMITCGACRTQAIVKIPACPYARRLLSRAAGNHHVLVPGDHVEEMAVALEMLGVRARVYG